jgi:cobalt-zinc-cadmium efflux system membrane fusion protein
VSAEGKPPAEAAGPNEVRLSAAAQRQAGIAVAEVAARRMARTLRAAGRITQDENRTWRVGASSEGRVEEILASVGDRVQTGMVLARMHSHDIHESRAEYQKAKSELNRVKTAEEYARRSRDRAARLYELKAASLEQKEHAEAALRFAQSAVANAEVELNRTRLHLEEFLGIPAEHPHASEPHQMHAEDLIPVRAPAPGVIVARNVSRGTVVTLSTDLFLISDLTHVWLIAEVQSEHLASLRTGMPVRFQVAAYGDRTFSGRIGRVGEALDPETRTVQVRVDVPNPHGLLKPEMYATAEIELGESAPALYVPLEAVQEVRGVNAVFVEQAPDLFVVRPVELGENREGMAEVKRGLAPGERVVVRGSFILKSEFLKASLEEE